MNGHLNAESKSKAIESANGFMYWLYGSNPTSEQVDGFRKTKLWLAVSKGLADYEPEVELERFCD